MNYIFRNFLKINGKSGIEGQIFWDFEHNYYRSYDHRMEEDKISYKIADHPILLRPWKSSRIVNNIKDINQK